MDQRRREAGDTLAAPDRTVVCVTGDGSILMNIQELVTAAEEQVNVKIVLLDNAALGLSPQQLADLLTIRNDQGRAKRPAPASLALRIRP